MDTPTLPPAINDDALNRLGRRIFGLWPTHVSDRRQIEERWMKNLYQVRKIYDPEVLSMIPADRSKAYPGMTAWMKAQPTNIPGRRQMPQFNLTDAQLDDLTEFLKWSSKIDTNNWPPNKEG